MKKTIITICIVGSLMIFLDSVNFGQGILLFLFAGVIPGTNMIISPEDMMAATATAITIIVLRLTIWQSIKSLAFHQLEVKKSTRRIA